ncbi:MAG: glucose-6-phosphate isomerase [Gammaproteobacteria bacterium]|nr:glucose-6-phosphate isomerase [Gammaproteobacteria bacterium]
MKYNIHEQLTQFANTLKNQHFNNMASSERASQLSITAGSLYLNYSRNAIEQSVIDALLALAENNETQNKINDFFDGKPINVWEKRAAKHWLLRAPLDNTDKDSIAVHEQLIAMEKLCERITNNTLLSSPVKDVICLGIGGSELGSRLVYEALTMGRKKNVRMHFVGNIDGLAIAEAVEQCNPQNTLFLVISKTFTTFESIKNFETIKKWFRSNSDNLSDEDFWQRSFAVTAQKDKAREKGFSDNHIFEFWDWVGGRFSLWSTVGLPIAIACGMTTFRDLLAGAHEMDNHFKKAPLSENMPVLLGLLHIWYNNYLGYPSRAVVPYAQNLKSLPEFLQQLEMESLGKSVNTADEHISSNTCPIVWGSVGSNAQHAYFQLLHQGTHFVPLDFIVATNPCDDVLPELSDIMQEHHTALIANCLAQSQALMNGGSTGPEEHKQFSGNRPSNIIVLEKVDAYSLGQLIALYEHKVLVQSFMWNINAFDQFGVELGKQLCNEILEKTQGELTLDTIKNSFQS